MTIYIVSGSTGEYSDRTGWTVRAVRTEAAAQAAVAKLSELARLFEHKKKELDESYADRDWIREHAPDVLVADPKFRCDYTGTFYTYEATELEDA